ncbi:MAG TPA: ATP-grasp domain-containing protein [Planktothrix sp.]|jgi:5-(carboxyamino)imidazole ribonucleotide synthase
MRQIGILGGGQLGLLLTESIYRLGGTVSIYDPDPAAPACKRTRNVLNKEWSNVIALGEFFKGCDAVTYEFENVESGSLFGFDQEKPIVPSVKVLKTTQDRVLEKTFIKDAGLPHVDFAVITNLDDFRSTATSFGFPSIVKTARGGYDGKGQTALSSADDVEEFLSRQDPDTRECKLVLERQLEIGMEVSCIVARSPNGEEVCFPVLENVHADHILDLTIAPARISAPLEMAVKEIALNAARALDVHGLLTTEFFLSAKPGANASGVNAAGWHIYINEFAPRPHNSGHITMKACTLSQFDVLARILLSIPIAEPTIIAPGYFCMANLLGDIWLSQGTDSLDLSTMVRYPEVVDVVLYGKEQARSKRKMGHLITYAPSAQAAIDAARSFRGSLLRNSVATT